MKITFDGEEYDAVLGAPQVIRIELETGRSINANIADPSVAFMCSAIAAALQGGGFKCDTSWVAERVDLSQLETYSQIVASLLEDAMTGQQPQSQNVFRIKR